MEDNHELVLAHRFFSGENPTAEDGPLQEATGITVPVFVWEVNVSSGGRITYLRSFIDSSNKRITTSTGTFIRLFLTDDDKTEISTSFVVGKSRTWSRERAPYSLFILLVISPQQLHSRHRI